MKTSVQKTDSEQFVDLVMQGIECWQQAGALVVRAIDSNPNFIDEVCDKCPDITPELVHRFEQIGRKQLCAKLLISDAPGVRRLRRLPYSLQEKHSVEPVSLILSNGESLRVDVRNLTPDQAAQVFAEDRIRSDAEQRSWIEDKRSKSSAPSNKSNAPYRVVGKKLVVMTACTLERKELARLLAELD